MVEQVKNNEMGMPSINGPAETFTWFSNPLDWRLIDRLILLAWLVMILPIIVGGALIATLLLSPEYINEGIGLLLLGLCGAHIVLLLAYLTMAIYRRHRIADLSGFENFIVISYTLNIFISSYVTGTHFTVGLLLLFLGVNIISALANVYKIRIIYFFVCIALVLFAFIDFTGTFDYAPLFVLSPLGSNGAPLWGWMTVQVLIGAVLTGLLYVCMAAISRWVERENLYREMSSTDGLTRLTNRRSFIERGESELSRVKRSPLNSNSGIACIMVDLDHFKKVNDTWGHHAGDAVLVAASAIMLECARQYDEVGRYGGEEFAILLPGTTTDGAVVVAERIREKISETTVDVDGQSISISASFGVACYPAENIEGMNDLLKAADEALYQAKETGRNRVVVK